MPSRPLGEPVADQLGLVGGIIVYDEVDVEVVRHGILDPIEETAELRRTMPRIAFADDAASGDIERGEQGCDAMAHIVMGAPLDLSGAHWQQRLAAIECLDLAFLID